MLRGCISVSLNSKGAEQPLHPRGRAAGSHQQGRRGEQLCSHHIFCCNMVLLISLPWLFHRAPQMLEPHKVLPVLTGSMTSWDAGGYSPPQKMALKLTNSVVTCWVKPMGAMP